MAISPKSLQAYVESSADKYEKLIDKKLEGGGFYKNGNKIVVELSLFEDAFDYRSVTELRRRYVAAGWKTFDVSMDNHPMNEGKRIPLRVYLGIPVHQEVV